MITDATVRNIKYPPELIPDSWFGNVPLNSEAVAPLLDIKRFSPYIPILTNIQLTANAAVVLRARYDSRRIEENTAAMLSALVNAWALPAKDQLYLNHFGTVGAPVANYTTHFGLWVKGGTSVTPSIADKLLYGLKLTPAEEAVCEELDVRSTFDKGLLPIPISQQIEREYRVIGEETHSRSINIALAGTVYTVEVLHPLNTDEILVLTRVAMAPGAAAQDVRFIIDRDEDNNFAQLRAFALSLVAGGEVSCFIPVTTELRLTTSATVAPGAHLFRYTFQRIKLSNILRIRFGLMTEDELPAKAKDVFKKVLAGFV